MIHIITPCSRIENISIIANSIPIECTWTVVLDATVDTLPERLGSNVFVYKSPHTGYWGHPNRNYALDTITFSDHDWIYALDDDNIIHPRWYDTVKDLTDSALNMVAWGQVWRNGSVRLEPTANPRIGTIDTSSYMVRGHLMRHLRYEFDYVADGILAERAFQYGGYHVIHDYLGYYNYLRTPPDRME